MVDKYCREQCLELLTGWLTAIKQLEKAVKRKNKIIYRLRKEIAELNQRAESKDDK